MARHETIAPATVMVPLGSLHPAEWNPRTITDSRFKALCDSIAADPDLLWHRPVLAMADGTIYAGNQRYRAAERLGWAEVPAVVEDVPEALAKARALRDNNQAGEWQEDDLAELLNNLQERGEDLSLLGFDEPDLARLLERVADDLLPATDGAGITATDQYGVIVLCDSEAEQQRVYEELTSRGMTCRVVVT